MDAIKPDGGPAYPRPGHWPTHAAAVYDAEEYSQMCGTITRPQPGMSYVDWVAGMCLAAMMKNCMELPTDDELLALARRAHAAATILLTQRGA